MSTAKDLLGSVRTTRGGSAKKPKFNANDDDREESKLNFAINTDTRASEYSKKRGGSDEDSSDDDSVGGDSVLSEI